MTIRTKEKVFFDTCVLAVPLRINPMVSGFSHPLNTKNNTHQVLKVAPGSELRTLHGV
jgi:hypothetical protein